MRILEKFAVVAAIMFLPMVAYVAGQAPAPKYTPTEVQALKYRAAKDEAIIANQQLQAAQQAYNNAVAAIVQVGKDTITAQNWPKDTQFDINNGTYCDRMVPGPNGQQVCSDYPAAQPPPVLAPKTDAAPAQPPAKEPKK